MVRRVYTALAFSLVITVVGAVLGYGIVPGSDLYWAALLSPFLMLPLLHAAETPTGGFLALGLFALAEGLSFGPLYRILAVEGGHADIWWTAVGATVASFGGLTAYVWATRDDLGWMQGTLYSMLLAMLGCTAFSLWFDFPFVVEMVYGVAGVGLFSAFILADTSDVLHRYGEKGAFVAACHLYLDILNLFLHLLRLLLSRRR